MQSEAKGGEMSLKMSRRGFVKASAVATASTLLLGASATAAAADEANKKGRIHQRNA